MEQVNDLRLRIESVERGLYCPKIKLDDKERKIIMGYLPDMHAMLTRRHLKALRVLYHPDDNDFTTEEETSDSE
jgi:hypothetical protein